ncbi:MAG: hypothetical protein JXB49_27540 [Bacteroidales bacterium]|nr:hypothetical protein [Bacteroidales bacterium]
MRTLVLFLFITSMINGCSSGKTEDKKVTSEPQQPKIQYNNISQYLSANSSCRGDFFYYIPGNLTDNKTYCTIFLFDPHGDGKMVVEKYKDLADSLQIMLICSNQLKNGLDNNIVQSTFNFLYNTTIRYFPVDTSQILFLGFSGGGRIALQEGSLIPNVKGVISCGAGQHASQLNKGTAFVYIAGNEDFNYIECREVVSQFPEGYNLLFITFIGKHEWPEPVIISEAIHFCLAPTPRKSYVYTNEENRIITAEKGEREKIQQNFATQSIDWWNNYINQLRAKASNRKDPESISSKRSINYISMIAYMHTKRALNMDNLEYTDYSLSLYKEVDPENPDMHFFAACYQAKLENNDKAIEELEEAVSLGFNNRDQIELSPYLQNLRSDNRFLDLLSKL